MGGIYPHFVIWCGLPSNFWEDLDKSSTNVSKCHVFCEKVPYNTKRIIFNKFLQAPNIAKMRQIALKFFKIVFSMTSPEPKHFAVAKARDGSISITFESCELIILGKFSSRFNYRPIMSCPYCDT